MSEPITFQATGPTWRTFAGWGFAAAAASFGAIFTIARLAWGWIPGGLAGAVNRITALETENAALHVEVTRLQHLNDGDRRGERLAALEAIIPAIKEQITEGFSRMDERLDSVLNQLKGGHS